MIKKIERNIAVGSVLIFILFGCTNPNPPDGKKLSFENSYPISVPEPSGLTFSADYSLLWTAGDRTGILYLMNKTGGEIVHFDIGETDIEGITLISNSLLALVIEKSREVLFVSTGGKIIRRISTGLKGEEKHGLEGIAFVEKDSSFFLVNEKNPGLVLRMKFNGEITTVKEVNFSRDLSGLFYDSGQDRLWIVSEESKTLYECDLNISIINQYQIPDDDLEGIAVDGNDFYMVSDKSALLYHFKLN